MKKYDEFVKCLNVLLNADKNQAEHDEIYRMGVIGQFNLTFELSWKALKEVLEFHGVNLQYKGSPRDILKTAFENYFLNDEEIWLDMLRKNEKSATELINLIFEKYLTAFVNLQILLNQKESRN